MFAALMLVSVVAVLWATDAWVLQRRVELALAFAKQAEEEGRELTTAEIVLVINVAIAARPGRDPRVGQRLRQARRALRDGKRGPAALLLLAVQGQGSSEEENDLLKRLLGVMSTRAPPRPVDGGQTMTHAPKEA